MRQPKLHPATACEVLTCHLSLWLVPTTFLLWGGAGGDYRVCFPDGPHPAMLAQRSQSHRTNLVGKGL